MAPLKWLHRKIWPQKPKIAPKKSVFLIHWPKNNILKSGYPNFFFYFAIIRCLEVPKKISGHISKKWLSPSVRHTYLFLGFCGLCPHCSCPNAVLTWNRAHAHPHTTGVATYSALFSRKHLLLMSLVKHSFSFFLYQKVKFYKLRVWICIIIIPRSIDRYMMKNPRHVSWYRGNHGIGRFIGIYHGAMTSRWHVLATTILTFSNINDVWFDNILIMMPLFFYIMIHSSMKFRHTFCKSSVENRCWVNNYALLSLAKQCLSNTPEHPPGENWNKFLRILGLLVMSVSTLMNRITNPLRRFCLPNWWLLDTEKDSKKVKKTNKMWYYSP